jgi:hypothetical protein
VLALLNKPRKPPQTEQAKRWNSPLLKKLRLLAKPRLLKKLLRLLVKQLRLLVKQLRLLAKPRLLVKQLRLLAKPRLLVKQLRLAAKPRLLTKLKKKSLTRSLPGLIFG